jgi:predicted homoserine dehydrogenase-like protein
MIILDKALEKRAAEGRPIRVGMIGAGAMGRGCANQIVNAVQGMDPRGDRQPHLACGTPRL